MRWLLCGAALIALGTSLPALADCAEDIAAVATDHDGEAAFGKHHRHALGEQVRVPHDLRLVAHAPGLADEVAVRLGKHVARVAGAECGAEPELSQRGRRAVGHPDLERGMVDVAAWPALGRHEGWCRRRMA